MSMFPRAMSVCSAPYLVAALAVCVAAAVAYEGGAPAWVVHLSGVVAALIMLPSCLRWEKHRED